MVHASKSMENSSAEADWNRVGSAQEVPEGNDINN